MRSLLFLLILSLLALNGCSSNSAQPGTTTSTGTSTSTGTGTTTSGTGTTGTGTTTGTTTTTSTPATVLQSLQASGALPTLDVSASIAGTDADGNGVRDDLDKYIAGLADSAVQKKALLQTAAAVQGTLTVDTTNAAAVTAVSAGLNKAVACVFQVYAGGGNTAQSRAFLMEELTMNTMPRIKAYDAYNNARNFTTTALPAGTVCK